MVVVEVAPRTRSCLIVLASRTRDGGGQADDVGSAASRSSRLFHSRAKLIVTTPWSAEDPLLVGRRKFSVLGFRQQKRGGSNSCIGGDAAFA